MPHAFLYISLPSLRDYDVTTPNFTWRFVADVNTRQRDSFSFLELWYTVFYNSTPEKIANIWRNWTRWNKRDKVWHISTPVSFSFLKRRILPSAKGYQRRKTKKDIVLIIDDSFLSWRASNLCFQEPQLVMRTKTEFISLLEVYVLNQVF